MDLFPVISPVITVALDSLQTILGNLDIHASRRDFWLEIPAFREIVKDVEAIFNEDYGSTLITPALVKLLSNETQVSNETPTTFIVHGVNDEAVPVGNALIYATALSESRVLYELHCPQYGPHGFAMGEPGTPTDWRPAAALWLQTTTKALLQHPTR